jgi:uncharacterized protein (DUF302 family)
MTSESMGVVDVVSGYPVEESIRRLEDAVRRRGLLVFARIDFSGDASRAGLALRQMQAILFGNPAAGTPLLAAKPRAGVDLPLRVLAWEGDDGVVRLSYDAPAWIAARHGLPAALAGNLGAIEQIVIEVATAGPTVAVR